MCSQCGTSDLSTPEEFLPLRSRFLFSILRYVPGILLLVLTSLYALYFLDRLLFTPFNLLFPMLLGLVFALLWSVYLFLPALSIRLLRRLRLRKK